MKIIPGSATAEAKARKNGYTGVWPPHEARVHIESVDDLRDGVIAKIHAGEHRASFVTAINDHAFSFFESMSDDDFRCMARAVIDIVTNKKNMPNTQIRAMKLLVGPVAKAVNILHKLEDAGHEELIAIIGDRLRAYADELNKSRADLDAATAAIVESMSSAKRKPTHKLVLVDTVFKTMNQALESLTEINARLKVRGEGNRTVGYSKASAVDRAMLESDALEREIAEQAARDEATSSNRA